ncbi:MAG: hypothetical protein IPH35_27635 [Rhodoferax sp.]|nr:hypothetical protein [Rhodoferax sp.]
MSTSYWDALLQSALVGSNRPWQLPPAQTDDPVGDMLHAAYVLAAPDAPGQLLRLAGALAVCRRAGWQVPLATAVVPDAAGAEIRTVADARWSQLLAQALAQGPLRLQMQVLHALDRLNLCLPPVLLPQVLQLGRRSVDARTSILPVIGARGRWLARHNPEWAYAQGLQEQQDAQAQWQLGSLEQRCAVLRAQRASDPGAARARLVADWGQLPAKERLALLQTLVVGLSLEDEEFLQIQLKDRAQDVRAEAADLLAALPNSAYAQRMVARLAPLHLQHLQHLQAPDQAGADWKEDVLEPVRPRHESLGERAWWLFQLARRSSLAWWSAHTGKMPSELVASAAKGDWSEALLRGWSHAALRQRDAPWCAALLRAVPARYNLTTALLAALPPEQREDFHFEQLDGRSDSSAQLPAVLAGCLSGCPLHAHIGAALSLRLASILRQHIEQGALNTDYGLRQQLPDLACVLHPSALPLWDDLPHHAGETASLSECLSLGASVLHNRYLLATLQEETL